MVNKRFSALALAGIFLLGSPVFAGPKKVWSSSRKKPKWISVIPEKQGYYYYVGISQNQEDKGVALQKALEEAMKQVLSTIGIVVGTKMRLDKEISGNEEITKMVDKYRETGKAKMRGQKVQEMYTEEYRDGDRRFFDVYLLLMYSEKEIKTERQRIEEQQSQNRREADRKMKEAEVMLKEGKVSSAFEEDARMFTMLADQPGVSQYSALLNRIKKLLNSLETETVSVKGKKPSVKLFAKIDGERKPVSGIRMLAVFETGEGEVDSPKTTGDDGIAVFPISKIKFSGGVAKLKIKPMEEQFTVPLKNAYMDDSDFEFLVGVIKGLETTLVLKAADFGDSKFALIIWDDKVSRETSFETALSKELTSAGISVRSFADIPSGVSFDSFEKEEFFSFLSSKGIDNLIVGSLNVIDNGDVYNLKSVTCEAHIKVIEIKSRKVLAAFEKSNTGVQINLQRAKAKTTSALVGEISPMIIDIAGVQ